jgi:hypothetical protein
MSLTTIRLTGFQVEKLQCIGDGGRGSPYRITVYDGMALGKTGSVADRMAEAANNDSFEHDSPKGFKRLLNLFGM